LQKEKLWGKKVQKRKWYRRKTQVEKQKNPAN
jgi:hypothetical protein